MAAEEAFDYLGKASKYRFETCQRGSKDAQERVLLLVASKIGERARGARVMSLCRNWIVSD